MASWSYALSRILIFPDVSEAICPVFLSSSYVLLSAVGARALRPRPGRMSCSCPGPLPLWEGLTKNGPPSGSPSQLFDYVGNDTRADGAAALSDREPKALVHGDRLNQLHLHLGV